MTPSTSPSRVATSGLGVFRVTLVEGDVDTLKAFGALGFCRDTDDNPERPSIEALWLLWAVPRNDRPDPLRSRLRAPGFTDSGD